VNRKRNRTTTGQPNLLSSYLAYTLHVKFARHIHREPDESESVVLKALISVVGYTEEGAQVREAGKR
jgi:hypothetical protein